jgi:rare lipoprotein A
MKSAVKALVAAMAPVMLVPCAPAFAHAAAPPPAALSGPEADYPVTIGDPYVIGGVNYTPADTLNYDAVGYAHAGTAGEGITGAHHTLPLPCYVEVTALDTGRTILVRLDRRGPMTGKQLVELSPAAWAQLGFASRADAPVRVRRVNPPETERARLRVGARAPERMDTPPGLLAALRRKLGVATPATPDEPPSATLAGTPAPKPLPGLPAASKPVTRPAVAAAPQPPTPQSGAPKPVAQRVEPPKAPAPKPVEPKSAEPKPAPKPAAPARYAVQVAAFSSHERAEAAAAKVGGKVEPAGKLWRVRIVAGSEEQARAGLAKAKQSGYAGAMILHHD